MARKRKSELDSSSDVLQTLLQDGKSELSSQFQRWKIWYKWPDIIGPTIAKHCEPVWFSRGTLFIWVKSSSWMQQLMFLSNDMKAKINEKSGNNWVKKIRFTLDRRAVPEMENAPSEMKRFLKSHQKEI